MTKTRRDQGWCQECDTLVKLPHDCPNAPAKPCAICGRPSVTTDELQGIIGTPYCETCQMAYDRGARENM